MLRAASCNSAVTSSSPPPAFPLIYCLFKVPDFNLLAGCFELIAWLKQNREFWNNPSSLTRWFRETDCSVEDCCIYSINAPPGAPRAPASLLPLLWRDQRETRPTGARGLHIHLLWGAEHLLPGTLGMDAGTSRSYLISTPSAYRSDLE